MGDFLTGFKTEAGEGSEEHDLLANPASRTRQRRAAFPARILQEKASVLYGLANHWTMGRWALSPFGSEQWRCCPFFSWIRYHPEGLWRGEEGQCILPYP